MRIQGDTATSRWVVEDMASLGDGALLWAGQNAVAWLQLRNSCRVVVVLGAKSDVVRTAVAGALIVGA